MQEIAIPFRTASYFTNAFVDVSVVVDMSPLTLEK